MTANVATMFDLTMTKILKLHQQYENHLVYLRDYARKQYADPEKRAHIRETQRQHYIRRREARLKDEEEARAKGELEDAETPKRSGRPKGCYTIPRPDPIPASD